MQQVRFLQQAAKDLGKLDKAVANRIIVRIEWLASNFDDLQPERLTGNLVDLYKLRIGDYRVIYEPIPGESILLIHAIGHRREIYRR